MPPIVSIFLFLLLLGGLIYSLRRLRGEMAAKKGLTAPPKPGRGTRTEIPERGTRARIAAARGQRQPEPEPDLVDLRPTVADFHVHDDEARVHFAAIAPVEPDEVFTELLVSEAIEYVREKRHALPMSGVTAVVALASSAEGPVEVGRATLETPGQLPPRTEMPPILNLSALAADPLAEHFQVDHAHPPETVTRVPEDRLGPIADELMLPRAIDMGLRAQGIDPAAMSAGELVVGMLTLVGYDVSPAPAPQTWMVKRNEITTFIRSDPYHSGDYPEIDGEAMTRFAFEFQASGAAQGLYVSDKYGPFEVYEREKRDPRIRFLTRERLQRFIDGLALG